MVKELLRRLNEHLAISTFLLVASIAGVAIGLWQWAQDVNKTVAEIKDPKVLASELATNKDFIQELAVAISSNPQVAAKLKGEKGDQGPSGPIGQPGPRGVPGVKLANTCFDYCKHAKKECMYGEYYHFPVHYNTKQFSCGSPIMTERSYTCICKGDLTPSDNDDYG